MLFGVGVFDCPICESDFVQQSFFIAYVRCSADAFGQVHLLPLSSCCKRPLEPTSGGLVVGSVQYQGEQDHCTFYVNVHIFRFPTDHLNVLSRSIVNGMTTTRKKGISAFYRGSRLVDHDQFKNCERLAISE